MSSAAAAARALAATGGAAVALAALELLAARRAWRADGVFAWSVLRGRAAGWPAPLRALLDALLGDRGFTALLVGLVAGGLALAWRPHPAVAAAVALAQPLASARFGGAYNGGSDAMLVVITSGLAVALGIDARLGLAWVAAQLALSYVVAGLAKLREPGWRDGTALPRLLAAPQYGAPAWARAALARRGVARAASWAVLALECGFPLALTGPAAAQGILAAAGAFHLVNAALLGLNRFAWAWLAAYPALLCWVR